MGTYNSVYVGITLTVKNKPTTIDVTKRVHPETGKEFKTNVQFCPSTGVKLIDRIEQKASVAQFEYRDVFDDDNLYSPPYPEFKDKIVYLVNGGGINNDDTFLLNLNDVNADLEINSFCKKYKEVINYLIDNYWDFEVNYSVFHYAS